MKEYFLKNLCISLLLEGCCYSQASINFPDLYQYERASRLNVSRGCVYSALKRLKVTYKKNFTSSKGRSRKASYFLPQDREL